MKVLENYLVPSAIQFVIALALTLAFAGAAYLLRSPTAEMGEPIIENGFVIVVTELECLDSTDISLRAQRCSSKWIVQNRSHDARMFGGDIALRVGEGHYPSYAALGPAFGAALFPDAQASGRVLFEIPYGAGPTQLVIDSNLDGRWVVIEVFPGAGP